MNKNLSTQLQRLEACRRYGPGCASRVERLLASFQGARFSDATSLARFHDTLLFLRAFPQSAKVVRLTEALLGKIASQVARLRESGADLSLFDDEQFSGVAGTTIRDTFTYEVARWLTQRHPQQVAVDWNLDEQARQIAVALPQIVPLLADDSLVEADTPLLDWLAAAAGGANKILPWLMDRLEQAPGTALQNTAWYDALKIAIDWELGDSPASRTRARRNPPAMYYHRKPLIQRNQVSLAEELQSSPLNVRSLSPAESSKLLDMVREALTVRYRELWGTTRGDPATVVEAHVGRGVHIFLWGLPPDRRLPLRAYYAGITFKNGVPINYVEGISLFEWMEVGFNTYYTFRDGETAWIYSKVLHFLHQQTGVTTISVYPYQIGHDNEEAIKSGAFWFYRKLGFRPGRRELLALTEREEARMKRDPSHRTSASTLRKLAEHHVFYEFGTGAKELWDMFSTRNIGLAVQLRMAAKFAGDPEKMRSAATADLSQALRVDLATWSPLERSAFEQFALVMALVPEFKGWNDAKKRALTEIIRAKVLPEEAEYLRRLQKHDALKQPFLRLGSCPNPGRSS